MPFQEVEVKTNNFSSEYGRSGRVTLVTLKSGANSFHGDVFDYFRNDDLNANDFFSNLNGQPRAKPRCNNLEGVLAVRYDSRITTEPTGPSSSSITKVSPTYGIKVHRARLKRRSTCGEPRQRFRRYRYFPAQFRVLPDR
jgi:hypothetical protein